VYNHISGGIALHALSDILFVYFKEEMSFSQLFINKNTISHAEFEEESKDRGIIVTITYIKPNSYGRKEVDTTT